MGAYRWELDEAPCQQCNTEGSGVGHLEVASRAALQIPSCDVPVQGSNLRSHGVIPPDDRVVSWEGAHLLGIQVEVGVVHCILQGHDAALWQKQSLTGALRNEMTPGCATHCSLLPSIICMPSICLHERPSNEESEDQRCPVPGHQSTDSFFPQRVQCHRDSCVQE